MNAAQHVTNNSSLGRPPGTTHEQVFGLPITRVQYSDGTHAVRSFWRPTTEELRALDRGALVCLEVWGVSHAPLMLTVDGVTTPT